MEKVNVVINVNQLIENQGLTIDFGTSINEMI